jgi:hypothetical protein
VDDARHQPLAGAGLTLQQHGGNVRAAHGIKAGEVADLGAQRHESGRLPHQSLSRMVNKMRMELSHGHISSC